MVDDARKGPLRGAEEASRDIETGIEILETPRKGAPASIQGTARSKQLVYNVSGRGMDFQEPDYNLTDVAAALDTESYFRVAVDRFVSEIWKNGWSIVGKDPAAISYVKRRLHQISLASNTPTNDLFEDIARQLVTYSNCFLEKKRSDVASGGRRWTRFDGKELIPIAGLFVLDATSMEIKRADNGTIKKYRQAIPGVSRVYPEWNKDDICHIHYSRQRGLAFGTPFVVPVLDDIRALRYMEQNVEVLVFQHAVPLYFYKVGTEKAPLREGELDFLESKLSEMPKHGVLMGSERHTVEVIGAEGEAIKAGEYLEYFKTRVLSGLRLGAIAVGEGDTANRSTAGTINSIIQDVAQTFQKRVKIFIDLIISELLAEGGFDWDAGQFDLLVELFIPEIDLEKKITMENHILNQWQGNAMTTTEMRRMMGREPYTDADWEDTHWTMVDMPKALISSLDEQYVKRGANAGGTASTGSSSSSSKKTTKNKSQPKNQHGTRKAPKTNKDMEIAEGIGPDIPYEHQSLLYSLGYAHFNASLSGISADLKVDVSARYDQERSKKMISPSIALAEAQMIDVAMFFVGNSFSAGVADGGYSGRPEELGMQMLLDEAVHDVGKYIKDLQSVVNDSLKDKKSTKLDLVSRIEAMEYRLDFMARTLTMKSYNQGIAKVAIFFQDSDIAVQRNTDEKDGCSEEAGSVDLTDPNAITKLPPYHPNCTCTARRQPLA